MLYKNLPDERLSTVMCCRFWLDRLAALQFLLKGERRSFQAVFRARADFRKQKKDFRASRKENLSRMVVNPIRNRLGLVFCGLTISKIVINTPICPIYSFLFAFFSKIVCD